jgi:hypothetical protein
MYTKKLTKNKTLEIEFCDTNKLFAIEFSITTQEDYAGLCFLLNLFNYWFSIDVRDNRKWHRKEKRWIANDDPNNLGMIE